MTHTRYPHDAAALAKHAPHGADMQDQPGESETEWAVRLRQSPPGFYVDWCLEWQNEAASHDATKAVCDLLMEQVADKDATIAIKDARIQRDGEMMLWIGVVTGVVCFLFGLGLGVVSK